MSWTHPESTFRKKRTSDALVIQLPSSSRLKQKTIASGLENDPVERALKRNSVLQAKSVKERKRDIEL